MSFYDSRTMLHSRVYGQMWLQCKSPAYIKACMPRTDNGAIGGPHQQIFCAVFSYKFLNYFFM